MTSSLSVSSSCWSVSSFSKVSALLFISLLSISTLQLYLPSVVVFEQGPSGGNHHGTIRGQFDKSALLNEFVVTKSSNDNQQQQQQQQQQQDQQDQDQEQSQRRQEDQQSSQESDHQQQDHQQQDQQQPDQQQQDQQQQDQDKQPQPDYYTVFSTGCHAQQHWQSLLFFYHAMKVNQPGHVTRIASGCKPDEAEELRTFHQQYIQPLNREFFHLHLTPDYERLHLEEGKHAYKYMNKPFGLRHWMEHGLITYHHHKHHITGTSDFDNHTVHATLKELQDGIVILMDPDMILLRPIVHDYTHETVLWVDEEHFFKKRDDQQQQQKQQQQKRPLTRVVRHGFPMAQQDGYLGDEWLNINMTYVTQLPPSQIIYPPDVKLKEHERHWIAGPPYLATVRDMYAMTVKWTQYAPRILETFPSLFSEMHGLIIAAMQLDLKFTFLKSLVVSQTETRAREGWAYIDALPDEAVCVDGYETAEEKSVRQLQQQHPLPIGLHYCQRYFLGKWFFSKYRVKKNIFNCEKALMVVPTAGGLHHLQYDYTVTPPRADFKDKDTWVETHIPIEAYQAKREAFMLCHLTNALNDALVYYKGRACPAGANLKKTYSVHTDPSNY